MIELEVLSTLKVKCPNGHIFDFNPQDGEVVSARLGPGYHPARTYKLRCPQCDKSLEVDS